MKSDNSIVAALEAASEADLEEIDEEISTLRGKLDSLTMIRKLLAVKLNGKPQRTSQPRRNPKSRENGSAVELGVPKGTLSAERRLKAARLLLSGPLTPMAIANQCDIPGGSITAVLDYEWFTRNGNGEVHLTSLGRRAATTGA